MADFKYFIPPLISRFYPLAQGKVEVQLPVVPDPLDAVDRSAKKADAVIFSSSPFCGFVGSSLLELGGVKDFGVDGLEDTVTESLNSIAGAVASGDSGRTYGTSGCREYGNTGNTVITPCNKLRITKETYVSHSPFCKHSA